MSGVDEIGERIAAIANAGGGFVTGWHLSAEFIDADGDHCWAYASPPDQRPSQTMGLIEWSRGVARHEQQRYLDGVGDDDD